MNQNTTAPRTFKHRRIHRSAAWPGLKVEVLHNHSKEFVDLWMAEAEKNLASSRQRKEAQSC